MKLLLQVVLSALLGASIRAHSVSFGNGNYNASNPGHLMDYRTAIWLDLDSMTEDCAKCLLDNVNPTTAQTCCQDAVLEIFENGKNSYIEEACGSAPLSACKPITELTKRTIKVSTE